MQLSRHATASRAVLIAALWPIAGAAAAQTAAAEETKIEEVVVTAARRETTLQSIPQSVAVLNGEVQRERGQQRLEDIQTSVPNVSFTNTSNSSQLYIRGIGNTFINAAAIPAWPSTRTAPTSPTSARRTRACSTSSAWRSCAARRARSTDATPWAAR